MYINTVLIDNNEFSFLLIVKGQAHREGVRRMRSQPPLPPPPLQGPEVHFFFLLNTPSSLFYSLNFMRGVRLSFLVLCSENARKRFLRRLLTGATDGLLPITRSGSWILFLFKVCIVPFLCSPLSLRIV